MSKPKSFETAMNKLESIVDQLESGEIPLDKTIKLYREGMEQYQFCLNRLEEVSSSPPRGDFWTTSALM